MRDDMSLSDGQAKLTNKSRICVLTDEFSLANARISPQARERIAIREWPIDERLREKLLARGPEALSDAELLAIMLRTGIRGRSAVHVARAVAWPTPSATVLAPVEVLADLRQSTGAQPRSALAQKESY